MIFLRELLGENEVILPTKHLSEEKSLLRVGGDILLLLDTPKTVSRLWIEVRNMRADRSATSSITFSWFVLALDLLFILRAVEYSSGRVGKAQK